jgi:hypothetical protein
VTPKVFVIVVVEALDGRFLDGSVDPLDLPIGPRMLHFGEALFDVVFAADPIEDVLEGILVAGTIGELDAIVRDYDVDRIRHGRDEVPQELGRCHLASLQVQLGVGELRRSIDGDEEVELALARLHLGNVDVEGADRVALERPLR